MKFSDFFHFTENAPATKSATKCGHKFLWPHFVAYHLEPHHNKDNELSSPDLLVNCRTSNPSAIQTASTPTTSASAQCFPASSPTRSKASQATTTLNSNRRGIDIEEHRGRELFNRQDCPSVLQSEGPLPFTKQKRRRVCLPKRRIGRSNTREERRERGISRIAVSRRSYRDFFGQEFLGDDKVRVHGRTNNNRGFECPREGAKQNSEKPVMRGLEEEDLIRVNFDYSYSRGLPLHTVNRSSSSHKTPSLHQAHSDGNNVSIDLRLCHLIR